MHAAWLVFAATAAAAPSAVDVVIGLPRVVYDGCGGDRGLMRSAAAFVEAHGLHELQGAGCDVGEKSEVAPGRDTWCAAASILDELRLLKRCAPLASPYLQLLADFVLGDLFSERFSAAADTALGFAATAWKALAKTCAEIKVSRPLRFGAN